MDDYLWVYKNNFALSMYKRKTHSRKISALYSTRNILQPVSTFKMNEPQKIDLELQLLSSGQKKYHSLSSVFIIFLSL